MSMQKLGQFRIDSEEVEATIRINYWTLSIEKAILDIHVYNYHNAFVIILAGRCKDSDKIQALSARIYWFCRKEGVSPKNYPENYPWNPIDFRGNTCSVWDGKRDIVFSSTALANRIFFENTQTPFEDMEKFIEQKIKEHLHLMDEEKLGDYGKYEVARDLNIVAARCIMPCPHPKHWIVSHLNCQSQWKEREALFNDISNKITKILKEEQKD